MVGKQEQTKQEAVSGTQEQQSDRPLALKLFYVLLLAWVCYIPDVKLDLDNAYTETGFLNKYTTSRGRHRTEFNGEPLCVEIFMYYCESSLHNSKELAKVIENQYHVDVTFAKDVGNSIDAIFFDRTMVIEVKYIGDPLPHTSKEEMLYRIQHPYFFTYVPNVVLFLYVFPLIFNKNFYENLVRDF